MAVKVTKSFKTLKKFVPNVKKEFTEDVAVKLKKEIIGQMEKGKSPVRGKRWKKYAESYIKHITRYLSAFGKRTKPVNLKVSGQLHESLEADPDIKRGSVTFEFTDPVAVYHDRQGVRRKTGGTLGKVKRRMLPRRREKFNLYLTKVINEILKKASRRSSRK